MVEIIDKRKVRDKSSPNRKKFVERYIKQIKGKVDDIGSEKKITDFTKDGEEVIFSERDLSEPTFSFDPNTRPEDYILPGNKKYVKGDEIYQDGSGKGKGGGGETDDFDEEFIFTLTKDEFLDLYFWDMELPNFIKKGLQDSTSFTYKNAGFAKQGIPPQLRIKKTFENAIARKISTKSQIKQRIRELNELISGFEGDESNVDYLAWTAELKQLKKKTTRYLDEEDVRYTYKIKEAKPNRHAVFFCLLDVSGSMGIDEKTVAKKFFLLMYLFLHKTYKSVELRFITHTNTAEEVSEDEFFYGARSGGTTLSSATTLMHDIIKKEYDVSKTNIYGVHISDGDNFGDDNKVYENDIINNILPISQYFIYLELDNDAQYTLYSEYRQLKHLQKDNFVAVKFNVEDNTYKLIHELFKKR